MKAIPMLFNTEMVKALISGKKVQTRRPVPDWQKPEEIPSQQGRCRWMSVAQRDSEFGFGVFGHTEEECMDNYADATYLCPFASVGDLIYVRETAEYFGCSMDGLYISYGKDMGFEYRYGREMGPADVEEGKQLVQYFNIVDKSRANGDSVKVPSIHMPRWASRLTLKVTGIRIERVQDISEKDAGFEGFDSTFSDGSGVSMRNQFGGIWQTIYGESWENNDWVWVIEFDVIHKNVDDYIESLGQ